MTKKFMSDVTSSSHIYKVFGLIFFCLIALGSGTSTQVIQKQNEIASNGKWSYLAPLATRDLWINPYSVRQTAPDVWMVLFFTVEKENPNTRIGPNWLKIHCQSNQYEEVRLAADGVQWISNGNLPIPVNTAVAVTKSSVCGADFINMDGRRYFQAGGSKAAEFNWRFYIRNNEVLIDPNTNERKLMLIVNRINPKDLKQNVNFYAEFSTNCSKKTYKLFVPREKKYVWDGTLVNETSSAANIPNILADRACNDNVSFMKKTIATEKDLAAQSGLKTIEQQCSEMGIKPGTQAFSVCTSQLGL